MVANRPLCLIFYWQMGGYIPYNENKEGKKMPAIGNSYGVIIVMQLRNKEHHPPHIHTIDQDMALRFLFRG